MILSGCGVWCDNDDDAGAGAAAHHGLYLIYNVAAVDDVSIIMLKVIHTHIPIHIQCHYCTPRPPCNSGWR